MATTFAPGSGSFCESVIKPRILEVVTWEKAEIARNAVNTAVSKIFLIYSQFASDEHKNTIKKEVA